MCIVHIVCNITWTNLYSWRTTSAFVWFCSTWSSQLLFRLPHSIGDSPGWASGFRPPAPGLPAQPQPVHRSVRPEQARGDSHSLSCQFLSLSLCLFNFDFLTVSPLRCIGLDKIHVNHFTDGFIPTGHWCKQKHTNTQELYRLPHFFTSLVFTDEPFLSWKM